MLSRFIQLQHTWVERVGAVSLPFEQLVDHRRAELPRRVSASLRLVHVHDVGRELVTSPHLRPLLALALVTSDIGALVVHPESR